MDDLSLRQAQKLVDDWIKSVGVRYFSELSNMAQLTEEVGELARVINRTYGDQSTKPGEELDLEGEIGDILFVLTCIANQTGTDLSQALQKNLEKKAKRDKDRHVNNQKLKN